MKFSLFTGVALLAVAAAAQGLDARDAEPELDFADMEVSEMVDNWFDERDVAGTPQKCTKVAKKIPKCARPSIIKCTKKAGCSSMNYKCGCKHKGPITQCATPGVLKACGTKKAIKARTAAANLCKCAK